MRTVNIKGEFIKLDALLKYANLVSSGGEAKILIQNGEVFVNNEVSLMRGKKIKNGDIVKFKNEEIKVDAN